MFKMAEWKWKETKTKLAWWYHWASDCIIIFLLFHYYLNQCEFLLLMAKTISIDNEDKICFLRSHQLFQPHSHGMYIKGRESWIYVYSCHQNQGGFLRQKLLITLPGFLILPFQPYLHPQLQSYPCSSAALPSFHHLSPLAMLILFPLSLTISLTTFSPHFPFIKPWCRHHFP